MAAPTQRLEIRVPAPTLSSLRQEARRRAVPVAELVREAIDLLLERDREGRVEAARTLFQVGAPVADWEMMKQEIAAAYVKPAVGE